MDAFLGDLALMLVSYIYIAFVIIVSDKAEKNFNLSKKISRKLIHVLTGNLVLTLPFYNSAVFPLAVASPFILITFLASPNSPAKSLRSKLSILSDKTEVGHPLGLVFYSFSFTVLTALFFDKPYIVAVGVMPMAYGDGFAALIGERYGKWKYKIFANKSIVGSLAMLLFSFLSISCSLSFFAFLSDLRIISQISEIIELSLYVSLWATFVEALSPRGIDNLLVPLTCGALFSIFVR
jgi:phytol kinase